MNAHGKLKGLWLAISLTVFSPGLLAGKVSAQSSSEDIVGIVRGETDQGTAYMMGGIGIDEREKMASSAGDYNLKLAFAEKAGVYLAGVKVSVEDQNGKQFAGLTANGPWFYLQLPPGSYTIKATFDGETKTIENVRITGQGHTQRVVRWDLPGEFPIYAQMRNEVQEQRVTNR